MSGRRRGLPVLLSLLVLAPLSSHFLSRGFGHPVPAFFNGAIGIGCLLAITQGYLHKRALYLRWTHSHAGLLLPLVILGSSLAVLHGGGLRDAFCSLLANISIALWLDWVRVNAHTLTGHFLNSPVVVYIGVLSYSIYLWQQPFLGETDALNLSKNWAMLMNPIAQLVAIAICTAVSYYLVERPLLRLRARFEPKWFERKRSTIQTDYRIPDIEKVEA